MWMVVYEGRRKDDSQYPISLSVQLCSRESFTSPLVKILGFPRGLLRVERVPLTLVVFLVKLESLESPNQSLFPYSRARFHMYARVTAWADTWVVTPMRVVVTSLLNPQVCFLRENFVLIKKIKYNKIIITYICKIFEIFKRLCALLIFE